MVNRRALGIQLGGGVRVHRCPIGGSACHKFSIVQQTRVDRPRHPLFHGHQYTSHSQSFDISNPTFATSGWLSPLKSTSCRFLSPRTPFVSLGFQRDRRHLLPSRTPFWTSRSSAT